MMGGGSSKFDVAALREKLMRPEAVTGHAVHDAVERLTAEFASDKPSPSFQSPDEKKSTFERRSAAGRESWVNDLAPSHDDIIKLIAPATAPERCLAPLLTALNWSGELRQLREALPHFDRVDTLEDLRSVLARLHYATFYQEIDDIAVGSIALPAIISSPSLGLLLIVADNANGTYLAFSAHQNDWRNVDASHIAGRALFVRQMPRDELAARALQQNWLGAVVARFKPIIGVAIFLSFLINVAALCVPFFVIHVYDLGIGTRSESVVLYLAIGAAIIIGADLGLRYVRARVMAYFGSRIDALIGMAAFQQLVQMPIGMVETAQIGTQISRLRQFESMRDTFTGSLATAIIDIPFVAIFLGAVAYFGGHLVWVPATLLAIFVGLSFITLPLIKKSGADVGDVKQRQQLLLRELIGKRQAIRDMNAENVWVMRHRELMQEWEVKNKRAQFINNLTQNLAQLLVSLSGVATLGLGTLWVMNGTMTSGALVGSMALVWRVLSPLQTTYLSITRFEQALQTLRQINRLMSIQSEYESQTQRSFHRDFSGRISISRLMFRYPKRPELALRGIQLDVNPGEVIAITGPSGAGKTTLLKMLLGLYQPLGGAVLVDALDLRQLPLACWRSAVGFLPEQTHFFYGTVAQNIRLARPDASDGEVRDVLQSLGVDLSNSHLPDGIETRLTTQRLAGMPDSLKQSIALARCFIKQTSFYLLDNPASNADAAGAAALVNKINELKGRSTIIMTTFRPAYMRLADRVVVLNDGQIVADGEPDKVIEKLSSVA